ncbi:MAG TPA: zf-HC2 domain-containing protein [Terriglobales bacterium]
MVVACEQVWLEVSNYLDGDVAPELRVAVEEHARTCPRCRAVIEGTRNIVRLYGDERMVEVPLGFGSRLHRRLEENISPRRPGLWKGWAIGFAGAAALVLVMVGIGNIPGAKDQQPMRVQLAQPGHGVPPDLPVVVASAGSTFHVPGCKYMHDKTGLRTITAAEASQEGYTPCVRCMKKYLTDDEVQALEEVERLEEMASQ